MTQGFGCFSRSRKEIPFLGEDFKPMAKSVVLTEFSHACVFSHNDRIHSFHQITSTQTNLEIMKRKKHLAGKGDFQNYLREYKYLKKINANLNQQNYSLCVNSFAAFSTLVKNKKYTSRAFGRKPVMKQVPLK